MMDSYDDATFNSNTNADTLNLIRDIINLENPDLVVLTGDTIK